MPRCCSPNFCSTTTTGHYTICCKKSQSCAPEDGQKFARNMLSWSGRSINCYCCISLVFYITLPTLALHLRNYQTAFLFEYSPVQNTCEDKKEMLSSFWYGHACVEASILMRLLMWPWLLCWPMSPLYLWVAQELWWVKWGRPLRLTLFELLLSGYKAEMAARRSAHSRIFGNWWK